MGVVRNELAILNSTDDRMTSSTDSHWTVRRYLGTAERERRQRHEVGKPEDQIQKRYRLGHLQRTKNTMIIRFRDELQR